MTHRTKLKEAIDVEAKHGAFFTGGTIEWDKESVQFLCQNGGTIQILDIATGNIVQVVGSPTDKNIENEGEDTIYCFTLSQNSEYIVTSHKSGLLKLWSKKHNQLLKTWKNIHKGPITKLAINKCGQLASGGSDGSVRLWDLLHQACTHNLRECEGVISVLNYHPDSNKERIFAAGDDTKIRCWNAKNGTLLFELTGHLSKVTSLSFHNSEQYLVSSGRDKVIILWDLETKKSKRILPAYETLEGVVLLPSKFILPNVVAKEDGVYVATAGDQGVIKVWEMNSSKLIYTQTNSLITKNEKDDGLAIMQLMFNDKTNSLAIVTVDHNIILYDLETFDYIKQFVGFTDEILDTVFIGENDSYIAVATNSPDIKLYHVQTMNCQLLKGHTDLVLSLAKCPTNKNLLLSSSKDNTVRLWLADENGFKMSCVGIGTRHTASVGSVAFSQLSSSFAVSASQDMCLKLWKMPTNYIENETLTCSFTELAHQKDINCVSVSPNDRLIATGSQDKTAKLWSVDGLTQVGVLRGHRRGIWCVKFSTVDQVLMTTSADCTVKLWSLTELNCLKTLEGHDSSVLKGEFISKSMQILTTGADGLIKLWTIKTSECLLTLDAHEGRIWALAVNSDESGFVSGGSDSLLIKWKDVTVEKRQEVRQKNEELILKEQELSNLIQNEQLLKALQLALHLEKPYQVLKIIQRILKKGDTGLSSTIQQLDIEHKELLLKTATTWNTNSKNCHVAQLILNILIKQLQAGDFKPTGLSSTIEAALPYTERHFKRLTRLVQDLHFINFTINCIEPYSVNSNSN